MTGKFRHDRGNVKPEERHKVAAAIAPLAQGITLG